MRKPGSLDIVTLNAKAVLDRIVRERYSAVVLGTSQDGAFTSSGVVLHTDRHSWCALFDQIDFCLTAHGVTDGLSNCQPGRWLIYMDFSSLDGKFSRADDFLGTPYGRAMQCLVDEGFFVEDSDGLLWHYTIFDKSSSNARKSVVSFLADIGYDANGNKVQIYDDLNRRLCLDIDFEELQIKAPQSILWNKYYAYRALYLTTAVRVPLSEDFKLTKESVLVIDTHDAFIPCDVRCAKALSLNADGEAKVDFFTTSKDDGGGITLRLFDGEGLIDPGYASYIRSTVYDVAEGGSQPSSFQVRMPFAKGVVHEVDFHGFLAEVLGLDETQYADVMIEDAFGIKRCMTDVRIILTTDMLKCHKWLRAWIGLSSGQAHAYVTDGVADPMDYYFAKVREYDHALYVLAKRRRLGETHVVSTNAQFLSTLRMAPEEFDRFAGSKFAAMGDVLFDIDKARELAMRSGDDDESAIVYALVKDKRFVHDPHIHRQFVKAVNATLVDYASGKLPVRGTLRIFSQDLLALLCLVAKRMLALEQNAGTMEEEPARQRLGAMERQCLDADSLYLPNYDERINETSWLAVFRNPHLSRSEQCVLRPAECDAISPYVTYFGHLDDIVMVSCDSVVPMVLGGADFDGDIVHIYDEAAIVRAVLEGAYVSAQDESGEMRRRYPVADLSGMVTPTGDGGKIAVATPAPDDMIGRHITCKQLLKSFQSNAGILSDSALRLSSVLYEGAGHPVEDACANYTIAVGIDIDSVKTGVRLDIDDFRIAGKRKRISSFDVAGNIPPLELSHIQFRKKAAPVLRAASVPIWEYTELRDSTGGQIEVYLKASSAPDMRALNLDGGFEESDDLKNVAVSNLHRLPWLLVKEARRIRDDSSSDAFVGATRDAAPSPFDDLYPFFATTVNRERLDVIKALVSAHHAAMGCLREWTRAANAARGSRAFGKARRRAQEYPTRFSEQEIDSILANATQDLKEHFAASEDYTPCDAAAAFEERGFRDWAICPAPRRVEALWGFLPGIEFEDDFYALLEDDALINGFMIPFYLIGAAQDALRAEKGIDAGESCRDDEVPAETDAGYVPKDRQMFTELVNIINRGLQAGSSQGAIMDEMLAALKTRISTALPEEEERLLNYLCVLKAERLCFSDRYYNSRTLFWDLLDVSDVQEVLG